MSIYSQAEMESLGVTNTGWGVCGFTSSFYAMYAQNPQARPQIINATQAYRVLAEIKTYLRMLQADNSPLLAKIRDFTRSFGPPYDTFKIDDYINNISKAAAQNLSVQQIEGDSKFSMAMPPEAVADYVTRMWERRTSITEGSGALTGGQGIIGVSKSKAGTKLPYKGLKHYMYYKNGTIYSWGRTFSSVADAMGPGGWKVVYVIAVL
ncbi:hypothetical protein [Roseospira visakhapatnamensis]|uniref:Uncharacterized protein n=1 Tax=Roseospira visakhapatnamensis TaxID=390880 RepID=A0A7W6RCY6_9PROT|nr:hypothetical protein [Roseospira visakhapatnamensis]MBB4266245.1 hypothetical protein [Roseospira visakhapatnamensis]